MAIYGYESDEEADAVTPLTLSEVTLQFAAADLRRIARFLLARADEIESGTFVDGGRHLCFEDHQWPADHPGCDVVVVPLPSGDAKTV